MENEDLGRTGEGTVRLIGLVIVIALCALVLQDHGASQVSSPGSPYLEVSMDRDRFETYDRVRIHVDSFLPFQEGNDTIMIANLHAINVTLYAVDQDLIVESLTISLFNGTADLIFVVEPFWTSNAVQVIAEDPILGLRDDSIYFETRMSIDYLYFLWRNDDFQDDKKRDDAFQIRLEQITYLGLATTLSLAFVLVVAFLRADHRRSRRVRAPSLWDRFVRRAWPYSLVPDDAYVFLDETMTWAPHVARLHRDYRKEAHMRRLRDQAADLKREAELLRSGRMEP